MNEKYVLCTLVLTQSTKENIVDIELSVTLGILGIAITIFTVIYSFLSSKLQQKKVTERNMHISKEPNPYLSSELKFMRRYIKRNKRINSIIIKIIYASIFLSVLLVVNKFIKNDYLFYTTQLVSFIYVIIFIVLLFYYIYSYSKDVR